MSKFYEKPILWNKYNHATACGLAMSDTHTITKYKHELFNKNYEIARMEVEEFFLCEDRAWHLRNTRKLISDLLQKELNKYCLNLQNQEIAHFKL